MQAHILSGKVRQAVRMIEIVVHYPKVV